MGQSAVQTVPACPVQIRAHHHIDVFSDINKKIFANIPDHDSKSYRTAVQGSSPETGYKSCFLM